MHSLQTTSRVPTETHLGVSSGFVTSLIIALLLSVAFNILLARKVRLMIDAQSARVTEHILAVGSAVPPITSKRLGGHEETISYQGTNQLTVLYIFTPQCIWCARNIDNLKTLANERKGQYRFIGLSLSDENLEKYVQTNQLKFPVYFGLSAELKAAYKLSGTPQTMVVSSDGRVVQNWTGAYVGRQQKQIEAFFHINLPGLRQAAEAAANLEPTGAMSQ